MIDRFDESAILIGGRRNERLVGSLRILCREPEEEWEHDRFWSWRDEFPPRRSTVDVSRLCLEWDERRIQSVVCLLRAVGYVMLELRRRFILACCTDELVGMYSTFLGARFTGDVILHEDLGAKPHRMFFVDLDQILGGRGPSLLGWLAACSPVTACAVRDYEKRVWDAIPNRALQLLVARSAARLSAPTIALLDASRRVRSVLRRRSRRRQIQGAPRSARAESRGVPALRD
jgi:hypothetical protein